MLKISFKVWQMHEKLHLRKTLMGFNHPNQVEYCTDMEYVILSRQRTIRHALLNSCISICWLPMLPSVPFLVTEAKNSHQRLFYDTCLSKQITAVYLISWYFIDINVIGSGFLKEYPWNLILLIFEHMHMVLLSKSGHLNIQKTIN